MVTLELNEQQAAVVKALVGSVIGSREDSWRQFSAPVFFNIINVDEKLYEQVRQDIRASSKDPGGIHATPLPDPDPFDEADVHTSIRKAVNDYGVDWVDPYAGKGAGGSCKNNFTDDEGVERHCLAGWVYNDLLGEPVNNQGSVQLICDGGELDGRFTDDAVKLLSFAQGIQDRGAPWGAVLHAINNL